MNKLELYPHVSYPKGWQLLSIITFVTLSLIFTQHSAKAMSSCYAVANSHNYLVALDQVTGQTTKIGATGGTDVEAMTFRDGTETLYAADSDKLGTIDIITGHFTAIGLFGSGNGSAGAIAFDNINGLAWDNTTSTLYAVQRRPGNGELDALFQVNIATGAVVVGAFNGADYVLIAGTTSNEKDVDDITVSPTTGELFGVENSGGNRGTLIKINKTDGAIVEVGNLIDSSDATNNVDDVEGLSFFNDGALYGSTGGGGPDTRDMNSLFRIDPTNGKATLVAGFPPGLTDYEALGCLTATIADDDDDAIPNSGEDANHDGDLNNDDTDQDGTPNYRDNDDDGDTILTKNEDPNGDHNPLNDDIDGDGIINYLDNDDDGDAILTKDEDTNGDHDLNNDDADGDGAPNYLESNTADTDNDKVVDQLDTDDDGDGILSKDEDLNHNGNLFDDNTDADNHANFVDKDDDGDKINTSVETTADFDSDTIPNYLDADSDNDGLLDSGEWSSQTSDPLQGCTANTAICFNNDADGDSAPNYVDLDSDNDTVLDSQEATGDDNGDGVPNWLDNSAGGAKIYLPLISKS